MSMIRKVTNQRILSFLYNNTYERCISWILICVTGGYSFHLRVLGKIFCYTLYNVNWLIFSIQMIRNFEYFRKLNLGYANTSKWLVLHEYKLMHSKLFTFCISFERILMSSYFIGAILSDTYFAPKSSWRIIYQNLKLFFLSQKLHYNLNYIIHLYCRTKITV